MSVQTRNGLRSRLTNGEPESCWMRTSHVRKGVSSAAVMATVWIERSGFRWSEREHKQSA